jgi:hypothetical protein
MFNFTPDPKVGELWCIKGSENNEKANYYELAEKRSGEDGPSYRLVSGRGGLSLGWYTLSYIRSHYTPWRDPWKAQRAWAKQHGFVFKEE